jgi:hypothetical protein
MAKLARTSGFGDFLTTGGVRSTANLGAFLIDAGGDLRGEDDAAREAIEVILGEVQPLLYSIEDNANGKMTVIVDNSQTDATDLQRRLRALDTIGPNDYDISGATVAAASTLVAA